MRAGWIGRGIAAAVIVAMPVMGLVGVTSAGASTVAGSSSSIGSVRSAPATSCKGRTVVFESWRAGKTTYTPGETPVIRGRVENCTAKSLSARFRGTVTAPCGKVSVKPVTGTLKAHKGTGVRIRVAALPSRAGGKSCVGTWKIKGIISGGGKTSSRTARFKLS
jgi:hypothetical protein